MSKKIAAAEIATGPSGDGRGATILIVEDSPVQAELLGRALEEAGYKVIAARNGAEGLAMAKANRPDAVVSDINMPLMDGYTMCSAIRRERSLRTTPVIMLTMLSDPDDVIRGLEAGADAYVTKPYNVPSLVSRIESLLTEPPVPPPDAERRRVAIRLAGTTHTVDAHGPRILNLLISTYENAVLQNRELAATQHALEDLNQHLEQRVIEQTAALQDSERRFRTLIEDGSDLVVVIDARGAIVYVSPSIKRLGGYEIEEVLGPNFLEFTHPEDRAKAAADIAEVLRNPAKRHVTELRFRHKNNTWITLESIERNALADPAISGVVMNLRDITERKLHEEALARKERYYRKMIEGGSDVFFLIDRAGTLLYRSESGKQLTGWETADVLGTPITNYVPAESLPLVRNAMAETFAKPAQLVRAGVRLLRRDGTQVEVEALGRNLLDDPDVGGIVITARDMTERKQAEKELRRLNWALRALGQSNSALVHAGTENELFKSCCEAIAGTGGYPLAWIGIARDDPARSVEIVAAAGKAIKYIEGLKVSWGDSPLGRGPTGMSIRTGAVQVDNKLAESAAFLPWIEKARACGLVSSIAMPIRTNGAVMGTLCVYGHQPDLFGEREIELFEELAADIGYGIASRRTRDERDSLQQEQLLGVERLKSALIGTIQAVALMVEKRDPYTAGHQQRVAALCMAIGRKLDLADDRLEGLGLGATIHDIGKIYVPADILSRPGKLSAPEFEIIKSHPQVGFDILKDVAFPWPVTDMILQHHERLDGSGYPQGLKGEQIILEARILAVADVVEAMISHRPYRASLGLDVALEEIVRNRGRLYDKAVVDACVRLFREKGFAFAD